MVALSADRLEVVLDLLSWASSAQENVMLDAARASADASVAYTIPLPSVRRAPPPPAAQSAD